MSQNNELNCAEEKMITVYIVGTGSIQVFCGTTALMLASNHRQNPEQVLAVKVNNVVENLNTELTEDCRLEFIDLNSDEGLKIYQSSLILVLNRAAEEVLSDCTVVVKHSLANGVYGEIKYNRFIKDTDVVKIEKKMLEIIEANETIKVMTVTREEAWAILNKSRQKDKLDLLEYWQEPKVRLVKIGNHCHFVFGQLVPTTGYLKTFRLRFYLPGFILEHPVKGKPDGLPEYIERGKLANIFYEAEKWGQVLNVNNVSTLNRMLETGSGIFVIRVIEAFQEKKIMKIADQISENIDRTRIILIAGPSSSGKTTFTQRLSIQLRVNGINPVAISLDDYFVDREQTPKDENGEYDFECIDAIDRQLFNEHLIKLIQGEEIELPRYNFKTGMREYHGEKLKLKRKDLIVLEGIHGLNDQLTLSVPQGLKFKIYISALTHLTLDNSTRIHTTDLRLLRRMVRDHNFRGYSALETMRRWPSVRAGEEKHIFPFQESADVMFNSALVYELAVLKTFAAPLLQGIDSSNEEYSEAQRLLRLLSFFRTVENVGGPPLNSILREFIGGGCFL